MNGAVVTSVKKDKAPRSAPVRKSRFCFFDKDHGIWRAVVLKEGCVSLADHERNAS